MMKQKKGELSMRNTESNNARNWKKDEMIAFWGNGRN
jgi:hypothetical protein